MAEVVTDEEKGAFKVLRALADSDLWSESMPPCTAKIGVDDCDRLLEEKQCSSCRAWTLFNKFRVALEEI